jgi:PAS domain S-box-containing protein
MSILDMIPAENRDAAIEHVRRLNPTHLVATSEHPSILPDNTIRWVQWTDRALLDRQGNVVQYQGVGRDITDQKRLLEEQSRHAREEQAMRRFLQTTLDALSAGLAVLDPDGTIVNVNNAWRRFNTENGGISPGAYVNTNYLSVCDGAVGDSAEEAQPAAAGIRAVINNQEDDFYLEYPCHSPHQQRWFGMRVTPFLEPAPRRVVVVHTDISERKLVEDSERVQRRIAEAMRDTLATLASSLEVETVLHQLLQYAEQVVPYNAACIVQFENDVAFVTHSRGFTAQEDELFRGFRFSISNSFYFKALQQGHPYLVKNSRQDPRWIRYTDGDWSNSGLGIPIIVQNKVFGALTIDSKLPNSYSSTDLENLQVFARYAALALENAHYAQRLEQRVLERTNELNHAKERVEAILNNSTDGILLADANLLIRQSNPSFNALFRTSPDNSFAKSLIDFVDDDDAARLVEVVQAVIQQQQGQYSDIRCVRSDGTRFDARFSIGYVFGEDAQLGIVCTIQDVTERKREQQLLAEERNMLRTLIDTTPDFIYIKDTNHRFLLSNLAHTLARGKKSPDELIGKTDADYFPQEVADQFHAEETEIFRSGIPLIDHEQPSITEVGGFAWASSKPRVFVRWAQARNCLRCGRMAANSQ